MNTSWTADNIEHLPWFRELQTILQDELDRVHKEQWQQRPALEKEVEHLKAFRQRSVLSLGSRDWDPDSRKLIEDQISAATKRLGELEDVLADMTATADAGRVIADSRAIAERLTRLHEVLGCDNASRINVELARHIDTIRCDRDGKVVVRTCKLGALALEDHASEFFASPPSPEGVTDLTTRGRPRKRGVRRLETADADAELRQEAHWAADVHRFASLGEDWFWHDEFMIPEATYWSKENALTVAKLKVEGDHMTNDRLAEHFGVTIPTIRKALRHAVEQDPSLAPLLGKIARTRWEDSHYREVFEFKTKKGMSVPQLSAHFGKSEPTIRKAVELAQKEELGHDSDEGDYASDDA